MTSIENRDYYQDSGPKPNRGQSPYDGGNARANMDKTHNEEREVGKLEGKLESTEAYGVGNFFKTLEANLGSREYTEILSSLYKKGITADNISFRGVNGASFNLGGETVFSLGSIGTLNNPNMVNLRGQNFPNWKALGDYIKSGNNIPSVNTEKLEFVTAYDQLIRNTDARTLFIEGGRIKFDQVWDNFDKNGSISDASIRIFKEKCYDAFSHSLQQRGIQKQDFVRYGFQKAIVNGEKGFNIIVPNLGVLPLKYGK